MNRYTYYCRICSGDAADHDYAVASWTCMDPHHLTRTTLARQRTEQTQVDEEEPR